MKKLFFLSALLAAGLAFNACSNDSDAVVEETGILDHFDAEGKARVSVAIHTPTLQGTRADGDETNTQNDQNTAASEDEYTILNAILILFKGTITNEANATFQGAYTLTPTASSETASQVDKIYTAFINSEGISATDNLLALVIANNNSTLTVNSADNSVTIATNSGDAKPIKGLTKFSDFQKYELAAAKLGEASKTTNGLYMSNAPLAKVNGSSKPSTQSITSPIVQTLAVVDATKITPSSSTAQTTSGSAISVYLERAASKVEVFQNVESSKQYLTNNSAATYTAANIKWLVDNTEPTFFAVRNPGDFDIYKDYQNTKTASTTTYRFFGTSPVATGFYRTYWAKDPHYEYTYDYDATPAPETNLTKEATAANINKALSTSGTSVSQYITENTMDINGLSKDKTTRVLLKVQFNSGTSFFTIGGGDVIYKTGDSDVSGSLAEKILEYVNAIPGVKTLVDAGTVAGIKVAVTAPSAATDKVTASGITISATTGGTNLESALTSAGFSAYTSLGDIAYYDGGNAYYQARIQHFGDSEAPLPDPVAGTTYKNLYYTSDATPVADGTNFLGRYGVVRNNWYQIYIHSIKHMGSATIPTPTTTPDDDIDQYLGISMYVLDWAKRIQKVDL